MRNSLSLIALLVAIPSTLWAAGGTDIIATKGQPAYISESWPKGTAELVNDPSRTTGWNSWFSEWPSDVHQYAMEIQSTDDLNRLIEKLSNVKSEIREIHLSPHKEPQGLGWVTQLPAGNQIPVIFSIGNQDQIDAWYKRVRKPFGMLEFTAAPVAVPPTLTIFAQNPRIELEKLVIPHAITVTSGEIPMVFHRSNTKQESQKSVKTPPTQPLLQPLSPEEQAATDRIATFLKQRAATGTPPK
ncbi:MAG: hypothetical protein DWH91_14915 [Planctomycetota bacterium]|nr:MAG: hypothetical protein DWH91_14915 [Planctomycetota bacterium]